MKTLTIILTDGPYISQYAEMAYKIASEALKMKVFQVNIFLYLDAVHVPKSGQKPSLFADTGRLFQELAERGAVVRACARCAAARGSSPSPRPATTAAARASSSKVPARTATAPA